MKYDDPEARFKAEVQKYVMKRGGGFSRVPEGTFAIPGDPDLILWYKGYYIGCEAKAGTNQHGTQAEREMYINRTGGIYFLCDSIEAIKTLFDRIDEIDKAYPRPPVVFGDLIPDRLREPEEVRKRRLEKADY